MSAAVRACWLDGSRSWRTRSWRSTRTPRVIETAHRSLEAARGRGPAAAPSYVHGDFLSWRFAPASFDFIACVAALHHMHEAAALRRMTELLRSGGRLAVIGLARSTYPRDLARDATAVLFHRTLRRARGCWRSPAPTVWPPPHSYREIGALAGVTLPGGRFRRHLLWRYSLVWTKPSDRPPA